jgi:hypothetical protein
MSQHKGSTAAADNYKANRSCSQYTTVVTQKGGPNGNRHGDWFVDVLFAAKRMLLASDMISVTNRQ